MPGAATEKAHDCELSEIFRLEDSFVIGYMCDICGGFWTAYGHPGRTRLRRVQRNSLKEALVKELWLYELSS